MAKARALIVPTVEEFGIAAVEANAAERPVIGPDRGGTRETVVDGQTGVLFPAGRFDAAGYALHSPASSQAREAALAAMAVVTVEEADGVPTPHTFPRRWVSATAPAARAVFPC
jgi:glycosyltransferase involved in cell wall biosynthesis